MTKNCAQLSATNHIAVLEGDAVPADNSNYSGFLEDSSIRFGLLIQLRLIRAVFASSPTLSWSAAVQFEVQEGSSLLLAAFAA